MGGGRWGTVARYDKWGSSLSCGGLSARPPLGRPERPPQAEGLPHKIVAAREEIKA